MKLYYFHILADGRFLVDEEGLLCSNLSAVQAELAASARDLMEARLEAGARPGEFSIEVESEDGVLIDSFPLRRYMH